MLDFHLAELYEVETKVLNQAVKRNADRFPKDFMFQLNDEEAEVLRSQIVTSKKGGRRYLPFAFTEQGVAMLSAVLNSEKAIKTSIAIVRAFVAIRQLALNYKDLQMKIDSLEKKYDKQFKDIFQVLDFLVAKKKQSEEDHKNREPIGFIKPKTKDTTNKLRSTKPKK